MRRLPGCPRNAASKPRPGDADAASRGGAMLTNRGLNRWQQA